MEKRKSVGYYMRLIRKNEDLTPEERQELLDLDEERDGRLPMPLAMFIRGLKQ